MVLWVEPRDIGIRNGSWLKWPRRLLPLILRRCRFFSCIWLYLAEVEMLFLGRNVRTDQCNGRADKPRIQEQDDPSATAYGRAEGWLSSMLIFDQWTY